MSATDEQPLPGPGALALDAHLDDAIGAEPTRRWHPRQAHALRRDQTPLDQVVARPEGDHWHLVTYGLSEIDAKESDDPDVSGWGFELAIRVEGDEDGGPPEWASDLLTNLAVYVWTSRHAFAPGHHVAMSGPIRIGDATKLSAAVVVADPVVPALDGPFGSVSVLTLVGVTADELEWCRSWSTDGVVELLARRDPLLVSRLGRASVLDDPGAYAEARERAERDGSSLTELRVGTLEIERRRGRATVVRLGAGAAAALGPALRRELVADGATFAVIGDEARVTFAIGAGGIEAGGDRARVQVPLDGVDGLAGLFDGRTGWGRRPDVRGVRFHVIP